MIYMYEVRCATNKEYVEDWHWMMPCNAHYLVREEDLENRTKLPCAYCNGKVWDVTETDITETEYFKHSLKDPMGTVGYQHAGKTVRVRVPDDHR